MVKVKHFEYWEHFYSNEDHKELAALDWALIEDKKFHHDQKLYCYRKHESSKGFNLSTEYFVGMDWLIEGEASIYVAPKINTRTQPDFEKDLAADDLNSADFKYEAQNLVELDYLFMLNSCMQEEAVSRKLDKLLHIDWLSEEIAISPEQDLLTPFLIVQYLNLLKRIVQKGLKKSYYSVEENLTNRVKGKILISGHVKHNVLKNRLTKTLCSYSEFGIDSLENQFLKKVLLFCINYIESHGKVFGKSINDIKHTANFCRPAFEKVSYLTDYKKLKNVKTNVFFKEYSSSIKLGSLILRRFGYNINKTSEGMGQAVKTPPFWIDMPKMFELYVYSKLLKIFSETGVHFQFTTYGNALDFLINDNNTKMVVDAKYKLAYSDRHIHQDIRQVSGYSRLTKVYNELKLDDDVLIDCLIIYPDFNSEKELVLSDKRAISAYRNMYKLGLRLPLIS